MISQRMSFTPRWSQIVLYPMNCGVPAYDFRQLAWIFFSFPQVFLLMPTKATLPYYQMELIAASWSLTTHTGRLHIDFAEIDLSALMRGIALPVISWIHDFQFSLSSNLTPKNRWLCTLWILWPSSRRFNVILRWVGRLLKSIYADLSGASLTRHFEDQFDNLSKHRFICSSAHLGH